MKKLKDLLRPYFGQSQLNFFHKLEAIFWSIRFGFPARNMLVVGITGTKGKTTTCHFTASILEEAGYQVGMATTVDFRVGDKRWVNETNKSVIPPRELQQLLRQMRDARCNALVLEVTSHALDQNRLWGIPFRYVGFTNLSHDHLDYHGSMERYRNAKMKLFQWKGAKACVVNSDDPTGQYILEHTKIPVRWSCSTESEAPAAHATDHLFAARISANSSSASFTLQTDTGSERVSLQLPGRFNIENALVAAALGLNLNIRLGTVAAGLMNVERVPGRLEKVETRKGFTVIIDYAHTPDSLEKLYATLRPDVRGRMIAVLGATGDRDKTKRPIMGALAARFCDQVILTDEEPYHEDPLAIIDEIARGVPRGRTLFKASREQLIKQQKPPVIKNPEQESGENVWWWKIPDRREAIRTALSRGKLDDVILITGMGAQTKKIVNGEPVPWSDREVVEEILTELKLKVE
jgi:UDP-N-acetylmuramoyl-L-alanyl-D-glutamate--2,6-diaminopimelate ligase